MLLQTRRLLIAQAIHLSALGLILFLAACSATVGERSPSQNKTRTARSNSRSSVATYNSALKHQNDRQSCWSNPRNKVLFARHGKQSIVISSTTPKRINPTVVSSTLEVKPTPPPSTKHGLISPPSAIAPIVLSEPAAKAATENKISVTKSGSPIPAVAASSPLVSMTASAGASFRNDWRSELELLEPIELDSISGKPEAGKGYLPARYRRTFRVTFYTTCVEEDPAYAANQVVTTTTLRLPTLRQFYYISAPIAARERFLQDVSLEGFGYSSHSGLLRAMLHSISAPAQLPPGTDKEYNFQQVSINVTTPGTLPLGCAGQPLYDGVSAAIVRGKGNVGCVIPHMSKFTIEGQPSLRIADDRVTGAMGSYHIDLYRVASRSEIQSSGFADARIILMNLR